MVCNLLVIQFKLKGLTLENHQPLGMHHQPLMSNQPNQMGIISNLALRMITADLMMNLQQYLHGQISNILQGGRSGSYGVDLSYSNQQRLTQTQQSHVFHPGPSSHHDRGTQHTRARARGRRWKRSMLKIIVNPFSFSILGFGCWSSYRHILFISYQFS